MYCIYMYIYNIIITQKDKTMTTKQKQQLQDKAMKAYPVLVKKYKANKKANHKVTLNKNIDLVYGATTNGDIIADFGMGRMMGFWDFIRSLD